MSVVRRFAPLLAALAVGSAVVAAVIVGAPDPVEAAPATRRRRRRRGAGRGHGGPERRMSCVTVGVEAGAGGGGRHRQGRERRGREGARRAAPGRSGRRRSADPERARLPALRGNGQDVTGYLAGRTCAVTLRDLGTAGATMSTAVDAGGDAAPAAGRRLRAGRRRGVAVEGARAGVRRRPRHGGAIREAGRPGARRRRPGAGAGRARVGTDAHGGGRFGSVQRLRRPDRTPGRPS